MITDFEFPMVSAAEAEGIVSALVGVLLAVAVVALLVGIVLYVLKSLGLYNIAKRRGIGCAWLAWLPVGCEWIAGSISDQYRKVTRGKSSYHRVVMLVVALAGIALSVLTSSMISDKMEFFVELAENLEGLEAEDLPIFFEELGELFGGFGLIGLASSVLSILGVVYWYVSMGDLYASCCPNNGTMLLVLSIVMPIMEPFFLFCNKNKDAGMIPTAQPQAPVQPVQPPVEPVQIPVEPVQIPVEPQTVAQEPWQAPQTQPEPWDVPSEN